MSTRSAPLDAVPAPSATATPAGARTRPVVGRFLRSELALVFLRRRNLVLLAVLALIPVLIGTVIELSSSSPSAGEGPQFLDRVTGNGLFLSLAALVAVLPLFLPLVVSVVAGDSVAGEANLGTLRPLLVAPVRRGRLLAVKYTVVLAFCLAAVLVVAVAGAVTGLALFPIGRVTLLSGSTVPLAEALLRTLLIALYVGVSMAGLGAIGLFVSTLTEAPVGATAATLTLSILSQVLDAIPQVSAIHPYLFSHRWMAFGDLLRQPVASNELLLGVGTQAAYMAVFLLLAWARFDTKDVSS
jgi:ABC-2 type transport system permease protein